MQVVLSEKMVFNNLLFLKYFAQKDVSCPPCLIDFVYQRKIQKENCNIINGSRMNTRRGRMSKYNIILENAGSSKVKVIQIYMQLTGASLADAKEKLHVIPCIFMENLPEDKANAIVRQLKGEGINAKMELCEEGHDAESEEPMTEKERTKEYVYHAEEQKEGKKAKKAENAAFGALEKISGFIASAVGIIAFVLLLIDFNGLEEFTNGVVRIFTFLCFACLLWFCVLKRYVSYWGNSLENEFLYGREEYEPEKFFDFVKNNLTYDGMQKLSLDESGQCTAVCKFGTHHFDYHLEEEKMLVTYECSKGFPAYSELCNMQEANYIAKLLKDHLYGTNQAEAEKQKLDKLYRLQRLGKLTPIYIILGILLLVGPGNIGKGIDYLRHPEIKAVQESSIPILGDAQVQKVLENFFGNPEWRFEKGDGGIGYVVFSGTAVQNSTDMVRDFEIYFRTKRVGDDQVQFEVQKMTLDGEEVSEADMLGMLWMINGKYNGDHVSAVTEEITYFAGSYTNGEISVSISQWSAIDFEDIEVGESCANLLFSRGEDYLEAELIKQGDNLFEIREAEGIEYYGTMYITDGYVEVSDSEELGLDGTYLLDYLYES